MNKIFSVVLLLLSPSVPKAPFYELNETKVSESKLLPIYSNGKLSFLWVSPQALLPVLGSLGLDTSEGDYTHLRSHSHLCTPPPEPY